MAETFQTVNVALGNSADAVVYTCPSATTAIVIHCQVANVDGSNAADLNIDMNDGSVVAALVSTLAVPADSAVNPIGGKLVLEAADELRAWAGAASDLEMTLSLLEIT
jgi:hypothetical protein|tara:strand:+ start:1006 stop:1329 length:324 start_codon:yes stop_codon:yes gene_type:complete